MPNDARAGGEPVRHPLVDAAAGAATVHGPLGFLLFLPAGVMMGLSGSLAEGCCRNPETALTVALFGGVILAFLPALAVIGALRLREAAPTRRGAAARAAAAGLVGPLSFGVAGSLAWGAARLVVPFQVESWLMLGAPAMLCGVLAVFLAPATALLAGLPWPGDGGGG